MEQMSTVDISSTRWEHDGREREGEKELERGGEWRGGEGRIDGERKNTVPVV